MTSFFLLFVQEQKILLLILQTQIKYYKMQRNVAGLLALSLGFIVGQEYILHNIETTRPYNRLIKNVIQEISISEDSQKTFDEIKMMTIDQILHNHRSGLKKSTSFALQVCLKMKKQDFLYNHLLVNLMCVPGILFFPRTFIGIALSYAAIVSIHNIKSLMEVKTREPSFLPALDIDAISFFMKILGGGLLIFGGGRAGIKYIAMRNMSKKKDLIKK